MKRCECNCDKPVSTTTYKQLLRGLNSEVVEDLNNDGKVDPWGDVFVTVTVKNGIETDSRPLNYFTLKRILLEKGKPIEYQNSTKHLDKDELIKELNEEDYGDGGTVVDVLGHYVPDQPIIRYTFAINQQSVFDKPDVLTIERERSSKTCG